MSTRRKTQQKQSDPAAVVQAAAESQSLKAVLAIGAVRSDDIESAGLTLRDSALVKKRDGLPVGVYTAPLRAPEERVS